MFSLKLLKANSIFILILISFIFSISLLSQFSISAEYKQTYYYTASGSNVDVISPSIKPTLPSNCNLTIRSYVNINGTYDATQIFYSPNETEITRSEWSSSDSQCIFSGLASTSQTDNGYFESKIKLTTAGSSPENFISSTITCVDDMQINFMITSEYSDSRGKSPNMYIQNYTDVSLHPITEFTSTFSNEKFNNPCTSWNEGIYGIRLFSNFTDSDPANDRHHYFYAIPFNSSKGEFIYDLNGSGIINYGEQVSILEQEWDLIKTDNTTNIIELGGLETSGSLKLNPNEQYVLILFVAFIGKTGSWNVTAPYVNYTLRVYEPDLSCGEWSECEDGIQFRYCVDLNGIDTPINQYQSCYIFPDSSANLGFEETEIKDVFISYPTWWLFSCPLNLGTKEIEYPIDWNINNITNPYLHDNVTGYSALLYDFAEMVNDDSTEGIKSLKLWYLPPEQYLPDCEDVTPTENLTCHVIPYGNYTYGSYAIFQKDINESFMLERDISFNYPNMTITLDLKKCESPVKQWAGNSSLFGLCGDGYYTNDKTNEWDIEDTRLFFQIYNYNTSEIITNVRFLADSVDWKSKQLRLSNLNTTSLYKFSLGISPESPIDTKAYCLYIDNIEINAYNGSVPCESRCEGLALYKATQIGNYGCSFEIINPSPACILPSLLNNFNLCEDFCVCDSSNDDYLSYYEADNSTGYCIFTENENSEYCMDYCAETEDMTNPISIVSDFLEERGVTLPDWSEKLFSPIVIIMAIIIIVMSAVTILTKSWQIGIITCFILLILFGLLFPFLAWIVILILVVAGLIFGKSIANFHSGNGG